MDRRRGSQDIHSSVDIKAKTAMKSVAIGDRVRVIKAPGLDRQSNHFISMGRIGVALEILSENTHRNRRWLYVEWFGTAGNVIGRSRVPQSWVEVQQKT